MGLTMVATNEGAPPPRIKRQKPRLIDPPSSEDLPAVLEAVLFVADTPVEGTRTESEACCLAQPPRASRTSEQPDARWFIRINWLLA